MTSRQPIEKLPGRIGEAVEFRGEVTVMVDRAKIVEACRYLKNECTFDMLVDLSGVDNYGSEPRFEVVYELCSLTDRVHLRLKVSVSEDDLIVDSLTGVWRTADWHEREAFDMFGIRFRNHPNLKRILMWEGYPYHPLRKDFPLAGMETELPATAVDAGQVQTAAMLGGPFVTAPGARTAAKREPRQNDTAAERFDNKGAS
jgi:NADH-quinone oxidoreductase subunit C